MAAISVKTISQEALDNFWRQKNLISSRSLQKGLHYAMEGYVYNLKLDMVDNKLKFEAKMYRSLCKREKPHLTVITIADKYIQYQHCSCNAGKDYINLPLVNLTNLERH